MPRLIKLMSDGLWPLINRITRENELDVYERGVLLNIISRAGRTGDAFPSQETISSDTAISLRQVQRALSSLSEMGFLTKERRGFGLGNIYHLQEEFIVEWMNEGDQSRQPDAPIATDRRDIAACVAEPPTNRQEGSKFKVGTAAAVTRQKIVLLSEEQVEVFKRDFPDLNVDEEIATARDHKNHEKWKTEYRYILNWLRNARKFNTPRSAAGTGTQPSSAALHNPVPKNGFEDEKAEALAKFKAARAKGYA